MKKCTKCRRNKDESEFNKNKSRKCGLNNICRKCSNRHGRDYYLKYRDRQKNKIYQRKKKYIGQIKEEILRRKRLGCKYCDEKSVCCMDFHHLKNKKYAVSKMLNGSFCLPQAIEEMDKCDVVCSNCHRKIHAGIIQPVSRNLE